MGDELGRGSGGGVSESPSRDNVHSETLVENDDADSEIQVEDSYAEGDGGGEIMVEIVGSDVFVDGVSGTEEADFREQNKQRESETAQLSEAMDVSSEGGENKIGGSALELLGIRGSELRLPESNIEKDNVLKLPELEEGKNNVVSSESGSGLAEQKDGQHHVFTESKDYVVSEASDVCCEGVENEIEEAIVTIPYNDIVRARVVNSEKKIIKHEAVDDKATTNLYHLGSNSHEGQIAPSEASLSPNGEGPESEISQVDGIDSALAMSQTVISEGSTSEDEAVGKKTGKDPNQDSCDGRGDENIRVDGFDNVAREEAKTNCEKDLFAEIKDLIVKSDALDSDYFNGTKFESTCERASVEEVYGILDFIDGESNVDQPYLSCVGNDEALKSGGDLETVMVHQNNADPNDREPSQPDDGLNTDEVNKDESQKVLDDGRLCENVEEMVFEESKQSLECQENDKIPNDLEHFCLPECKEPEEASLDTEEDESFVKKQKTLDLLTTDGYDKRVSTHAVKVSTLMGQNTCNNKPSFKIGECIRRVASQLTGSIGKDETVIDGSLKNTERRSMVLSIESFSVNEMLSQLERVSQEPMRRHNFLNVIHTFFMGFRSSIALNRRGRKRRPEQMAPGEPAEGFEFDDVSDSYWTDRIVQHYSELNGSVGNLHAVPVVTVKPSRRPNSRKRFSDLMVDSELEERIKRRKHESSPTELILYFPERDRIPSEINLNKMFRRFGSLMESETEVDHESSCAKVIFKRGSDAEIARNSSEAFNIFGPVLVNYHIGYEPVVSVRVLPMALPQPQEDTCNSFGKW